MYFIYILRCAGGSLYSGITTDISRRYSEHTGNKAKGAKYTASHAPVGIERLWSAPDRKNASKLEYRLKKLTKSVKEDLLAGKVTLEDLFAGKLDCSLYCAMIVPEELSVSKGR